MSSLPSPPFSCEASSLKDKVYHIQSHALTLPQLWIRQSFSFHTCGGRITAIPPTHWILLSQWKQTEVCTNEVIRRYQTMPSLTAFDTKWKFGGEAWKHVRGPFHRGARELSSLGTGSPWTTVWDPDRAKQLLSTWLPVTVYFYL